MKSVLIGNGINIQFGGKAYSNYFIMERIKFKAKIDGYLELFDNTLSGDDIIMILDGFVDVANDIRNNKYDEFIIDEDTEKALMDFKKRYLNQVEKSYEIMLEDWFFLIHMFFIKNVDLTDNKSAAIQGFERIVLDAIYNEGKIQSLYLKMNKKVKKFFKSFDNIFTLNYDNNIEELTKCNVFHLHGDFSILSNSENSNHVLGYIRKQKNKQVVIEGMEHCFCNALLNYSGALKYKSAELYHTAIEESQTYTHRYRFDSTFCEELAKLKMKNSLEYELIMTKIKHPELNMATEYYFDKFKSIEDELHIIGMSPNNDEHIFDLIINNPSIKKVIFYYFSETEKNYIEKHYPNDIFACKSVQELWKSLNAIAPQYNCHYSLPSKIDEFILTFNFLSGSKSSKKDILEEISHIPEFKARQLVKIVKEDMLKRNPENQSTDQKESCKERASISYIALQNGILPSALYLIYTMFYEDD